MAKKKHVYKETLKLKLRLSKISSHMTMILLNILLK